ncbi:hypothetical protein SS05631_c31630 [Sinorhizobium sp. CCBAU 05631]|nr:hypothetical protein SS05631_c31630 [Sinorhizobium sp. CCBAU 05631]
MRFPTFLTTSEPSAIIKRRMSNSFRPHRTPKGVHEAKLERFGKETVTATVDGRFSFLAKQ